ncbi:MAG: sulfotransferase domain-containing protein [Alphaproteobacteria bacterium]|jgi:hypothetical protein|nr:sulfotransferase domain-containing protein [Alphaproteobacteria bacterium]
MQAIAVGCDYNDKTPYSVDIVNKVWSLVLANSAPGDAICVLDFEGHGARFEALSRSHGEQRDVTFIDGDRQLYRRRWNSLEKTFADQHYKYVIILSHPRDYHYIVRYVNYHFVGEPTPVLPFVSTGGANPTTVELGMADPAPIIGMGFPGAGSDRLMPVFRALMDMYSIEQHYYVSPISNRRYIRRRADPDFRRGGPIPDGRMFDADVKEDAVSIYNDGSASVNTSMRKGIKGDWKNHFTPRVANRFKEIAGETLIKIGYESDMNW